MSARTSVILCTAGGVLTFAVSGHPAVVDVQLVGVILMLTGIARLWPRGAGTWLLRGRSRLRQLLDETAPVRGARVPLDELLAAGRGHARRGAACLRRAGRAPTGTGFPSADRR